MKFLIYVQLVMILSGCATVKGWFGMNEPTAAQQPVVPEESFVKYSEVPQQSATENRAYRRMTRERMEEESELTAQAGSLWMMEGQTSYLFSQNKVRNLGDVIPVKMEGIAMKQIETKVSVIRKLLKQLEEQQAQQALQLQLAKAEKDKLRAPASAAGATPAAPAPAPAPVVEKKKDDEKQDLSEVQMITSKITEKMPDGNYRVKGQQPFMIGKREFKVIITGMIRPEDYNESGISSQKLLDPQFDVISIRKNKENEAKTN